MAHYALLDENNIVTQVISGADEDNTIDLPDGYTDWETWYKDLYSVADCKRTSYNTRVNTHTLGGTPFRANYATIDGTYDTENDVFYGFQPYDSWTLNSDWIWQSPVPYPGGDSGDGNFYNWNEETTSWDLVEYTE
jgi:hypothetical protein